MTSSIFLFLAVALGMSILIGYFTALIILPLKSPVSLAWAFAPGLGGGICSLIFFVFRRPMFTVEFSLLIVLGVIAVSFRGLHLRQFSFTRLRAQGSILTLALAAALGLVAPVLVIRTDRLPHGETDGWAIWNSHARLLYRAGTNWKESIPYTFHGDYGLLTPSLTARMWRYAETDPPEAGALLGVFFALSTVAVLLITVAQLRDLQLGVLLALVLLGTPKFLEHATSQYADVPLSLFILSTLALFCFYWKEPNENRGFLVLAGFMAGCAGWTKNEGILFIGTAGAALIAVGALKTRVAQGLIPFAAGLLLPLAVVIFFKVTVGVQTDIAQQRHFDEMLVKVLSLDRHFLIFRNVVRRFWSIGLWAMPPMIPLVAFITLRGIDWFTCRSFGWLTSSITLASLAAGYYAVYVLTPLDLQYHLDSSLDRLFIHLLPSLLLLLGLMALPAKSEGVVGQH